MSSGGWRQNRGTLDDREEDKSALRHKVSLRRGSEETREDQSLLQSKERATGHKEGLGRYGGWEHSSRERLGGMREIKREVK